MQMLNKVFQFFCSLSSWIWNLNAVMCLGGSSSTYSWFFATAQNVWDAATTFRSIYGYYIACYGSYGSTYGWPIKDRSQSNPAPHTEYLCDSAWNSSGESGQPPSGIYLTLNEKMDYKSVWIFFFKKSVWIVFESNHHLCLWIWPLTSFLVCKLVSIVTCTYSGNTHWSMQQEDINHTWYDIHFETWFATSSCSWNKFSSQCTTWFDIHWEINNCTFFAACSLNGWWFFWWFSVLFSVFFLWKPATSDYIVKDTGNCSPRYMRCTINQVIFLYLTWHSYNFSVLNMDNLFILLFLCGSSGAADFYCLVKY